MKKDGRNLSRRSAFARWLALGITPAATILACSAGGSTNTNSDDVTSVENTDVKSQAIGNCWLYATAGWAESLHKGATGDDVNLSEAYWNYWYWYEQLTGGTITLPKQADDYGWESPKVTQGGWWGLGAELIRRYGFMNETDFIPEVDDRADRHKQAVDAINQSLSRGALSTPASRRDARLVRDELNKAWQLPTETIAALEAVFPVPPAPAQTDAPDADSIDDGGVTDGGAAALPPPPVPFVDLADRTITSAVVHAPQELAVLAADGRHNVTLADVVGRKVENSKVGDGVREGDEAWSELRYTWDASEIGQARRAAFLKNLRNVLNQRLAVPLAWVISNAAKDGTYRNEGLTDWSLGGLHESLLVDYEIENVPGFGTLRVDERETRPDALEATLSDGATPTFFRIKNSWGTERVWSEEELRQYGMRQEADADGGLKSKPNYLPSKPGYNDLYMDFLDRSTTYGEKVNGHVMFRLAMPKTLRFEIPELPAPVPNAGADAGPASDAGAVTDAGAGKK